MGRISLQIETHDELWTCVSVYFLLEPLIGPLQDFVMSVHLLLRMGLGLIIDCTP